jgi:hypothetical protein
LLEPLLGLLRELAPVLLQVLWLELVRALWPVLALVPGQVLLRALVLVRVRAHVQAL